VAALNLGRRGRPWCLPVAAVGALDVGRFPSSFSPRQRAKRDGEFGERPGSPTIVRSGTAGTRSGVRPFVGLHPGGVARSSLNHRLQAL